MTWLWRTCSSLLWAGSALAATVGGRVELAHSRDTQVNRQRNFSDVVVWLEPVRGDATSTGPHTAKMLQKGKRFIPHVLAIPLGTTVEFPNLDPIFHNAFSNFSGQPFDTGLYPPGASQKVTFRRDGIVRVFCNIHSTMSAVIVVTKSPYVSVTDRRGAFRIEGVPPGEYQLRVFHERATEASLRTLERKITVGEEEVELPLIRVSESGYLEVPHKNKYGQDYPEAPLDHLVYPGVRR